jgi:hypothetical protein
MDTREVYLDKLQAQLNEWYGTIESLKQEAIHDEPVRRDDYAKRIVNLEFKCEAAKEKIAEIRAAQDRGWEELRDGAEQMWGGLKQLFQETKTAFHEGRQEADNT